MTHRKNNTTTSSHQLSVIVPAYNETENIEPLTDRLFKACSDNNIQLDLLIMDDESVGSEPSRAKVESLKQKYKNSEHTVRIHCRKKKEGKGLASAVILGFEKAKYDTLLCMDADLQHEPEAVPSVAQPVLTGRSEFSVGSRFTDGGEIGKDWPAHRRLISWVATMLAVPLASTTDPMSGFFCLTKEVFLRGRENLQVSGFKISLELMARCKPNKVIDVGISFKERVAGESKLTMTQNVQYLQQLATLYIANLLWLVILLFLFVVAVLYYIAGYIGVL
jgi:dolichol-phosphate mannosyltransferase